MADALSRQESKASRSTFLDDLASPTPTPGGGSASAYVGAMAAALLVMYTGLTTTKKSYRSVWDEMERVRTEAVQLKDQLSTAVED
ncbi:MAG: cyclodeaminase/cyclohydrolase family protein, partial [Chloroflexi bacterium]|nr:cyclodeaminase/cyclohydrolase family protein [Chloroflexota bacterium]